MAASPADTTSRVWSCGTINDGVNHVVAASRPEEQPDEEELRLMKEIEDQLEQVWVVPLDKVCVYIYMYIYMYSYVFMYSVRMKHVEQTLYMYIWYQYVSTFEM
jgi:hypothetical protein